jgi:hypothetical protein
VSRSKKRRRRWYFDDWDDWDPIPKGPYHPGCSFHDGKCAAEGPLHFYAAPNGHLVMGLCDNHVRRLDPELAGFEVTHVDIPVADNAVPVDDIPEAIPGDDRAAAG